MATREKQCFAQSSTPNVYRKLIITKGEKCENYQSNGRRTGARPRGHVSYSAHAQDKGLVGVLMPTKTSQRWINDGDAVKSQLEALGYTVDLQYAQDDIPNQLSQLENEITKGPKALIIASIDGTTLSDALQKAADAGVVVVAYDRLIKKTPERRLLHHLRQFRRRRHPGQLAGQGPQGTLPRQEAVERRTVRRLAGRQQRLLLLRRRNVACCSR